MQSQGRLTVMRECDWKEFLKNRTQFPETKLHHLLVRDNEATLLEAIKHDKIFGFLGKLVNIYQRIALNLELRV